MVLPRKFQNSPQILRKIKSTIKPSEGQQYMINRNPRNLEFLRIATKPGGYKLDKPGFKFWNKLNLIQSHKYITAQMVHFEKGAIVEASTSEWSLKKQLFKTADTAAYSNLARVFAQRCLESGFIEMSCELQPAEGGKVEAFLNILKNNGLVLSEPTPIKPQLEVNHYIGRKVKPYGDWEEH